MTASLAALVTTWPALAAATVFELSPAMSDTDEEFENVANRLQPGDELVLRGGVYSQTGPRTLTINGTAEKPITIRSAAGETAVLTRPAGQIDTQNNIEISNSSYLILRGLHFDGGSTGMRFLGGHHITIERSEISRTGNNAIAMNSGNSEGMVIRRNHIHHTGLSTSRPTEGEGLYLGCNNNACRVINSLVEGNYIHHTRGTSDGGNDGIEVKVGSFGNLIRHNVIHDTTIGRQFPCIFVYGGGAAVNTVEANVMWNCGEGIQVVSDAVVRNNIILSSEVGILSSPHVQVAQMRNLTIIHNTVVGHGQCLVLGWSGVSSATLANNAVYCGGTTAVTASGLGGAGITVRANAVEGTLSGASIDGLRLVAGGRALDNFRDPAARDLWPVSGSVLIGKANTDFAAARDVNDRPRARPADVGAYETDGLAVNPGWKIIPDFKALTIPSSPTKVHVW
ncbi:MAG: right-handed parallel beta-helix repeat-containing protein [Nitrospiria bacterium]